MRHEPLSIYQQTSGNDSINITKRAALLIYIDPNTIKLLIVYLANVHFSRFNNAVDAPSKMKISGESTWFCIARYHQLELFVDSGICITCTP